MIVNVLIYLLSFLKTVTSDLFIKKKGSKTITAPILLIATFILCLVWIAQNYPFEQDSLAELLVSGNLVVYPLLYFILYVMISFFTRGITEDMVTDFLKEHGAHEIMYNIFELALGSIKAVVLYLKIITGDFLSSIVELTNEENLENDLEDETDG